MNINDFTHKDNILNKISKYLNEKELELLDNSINRYGIDFKKICDNLFDGIYVAYKDGTTIYVNPSYLKNLGVKEEDVVGKKVYELEGKIFSGAVSMEVIKKKKRIDNIGILHKNNIPVLITGIPVFDDNGEVLMAVISNRNLTEINSLKDRLQTVENKLLIEKEHVDYLLKNNLYAKPLVYKSAKMKYLLGNISRIAKTDATIFIRGESGTGKELIANEIFQNSQRNDKPYIKVNCAAIPQNLIESELFGYEEGSFTGARKNGKIGIFELANNGTLLLDEIGTLSMENQAKLLRVLQEKEIMRIGGNKVIPLNIRLIAATNIDIEEAIKRGEFREDLFYRLNVIPIYVPALRERAEDIEPLTKFFLDKFNNKYYKNIKLNKSVVKMLEEYKWPGNIRELENIIERMVVTAENDSVSIQTTYNLLNPDREKLGEIREFENITYDLAFESFERKLFINTLSLSSSLRKAAEMLKISPASLSLKCKKYAIKIEEYVNKG
ncbi:sigma-54 interaction domain-containing protein [Peptoniphilaceae bacterium SGI.131]